MAIPVPAKRFNLFLPSCLNVYLSDVIVYVHSATPTSPGTELMKVICTSTKPYTADAELTTFSILLED